MRGNQESVPKDRFIFGVLTQNPPFAIS